MKVFIRKAVLFFSVLSLNACTANRKNDRQQLPFQNIVWKLDLIENDTVIDFQSNNPSEYYSVVFNNYHFRKFDGQFVIEGSSKDSNSMYYNRTGFVGFYNFFSEDSISTSWFRNISWPFDFKRNKFSRAIGGFPPTGKYKYTKDSLIFYQIKAGFRKQKTIFLSRLKQ